MIALAAALLLTLAPAVLNENPSPGAHLRTFYPSLSASIRPGGAGLRPSTVHLFVDGRDVTPHSTLSNDTITYVPQTRMDVGWHAVFLEGANANGHAFNKSWAFETLAPDGSGREATQFAFFPSGAVGLFPGNFVNFAIIAPVGGVAFLQFCGFGNFAFQQFPGAPVFFTTLPGTFGGFNPFVNCQVSAFFTPFNGFGTVLLPLPVPIGIAGPDIAIHSVNRHMPVPVYRADEPVAPRKTAPIVRAAPEQGVQIIYGIPPTRTAPVEHAMPAQGVTAIHTMPVQHTAPIQANVPVRYAVPGVYGAPGYPMPYVPSVRTAPGMTAVPGVPVISGVRTTAPVMRAPAPSTVHVVPVVHPAIPIPHPR